MAVSLPLMVRPATATLDFLFLSSPGDGPVGHPCKADSRVGCGISVQDSGSKGSLQHMIVRTK